MKFLGSAATVTARALNPATGGCTFEQKFMSRYFEAEKFNPQEFALTLIENQKADLDKRVGKYQPFKVDVAGLPDFPFSRAKETDRREVEAMFVAQQMAREGFTNFLWLSPPGGDYNYTESRFTWLKVKKIDEKWVSFDDNRAICGNVTPEKCITLLNCLIKDGGEIWGEPKNPEEIRSYVIGFKDDQIIERLANSVVEMENVWEAIRKGKDNDNLKKMMDVAEWVEAKFGQRMKGVKSERESIFLGATIERQLRLRFAINLMAGGGHGMSNEASLFDSIYKNSKPIEMDGKLDYCERHQKCFMKKKGKCPLCESESSN